MKQFLKKQFSTLYFFYGFIGKKLYAVFGFSSLMVFMDSVGIALFIPLLQAADKSAKSTEGASNEQITKLVEKIFSFLNLDVTIINMLLLIIAIFTFKGIFFYYTSKYNALAQQTVSLKMRTRLAEGVKNLSFREFVITDIGRMQNSLLAEVWQVITGCMQYIEAMKNGLFVSIYLVFAFFIDWKFSILVIIGGALTNFIYKYFYVRTQRLSREITKNNHRYGGLVVEVINHFKYFKATGRDILFFNRLQNELEELVNNNIKVAKLGAKLSALREPMTVLVICAVILLHVTVFKSPLSGVIIILLFFYRVMNKIIDIQNNWNTYLSHTGSIENIISFQQYLDKHSDSFYNGSVDIKELEQIQLKDIKVQYEGLVVLDRVSIDIHKNQTIAFVGESGSGKTTLVNVISTLLPFDSGDFLLNGRDIRDYNIKSYKSKIGYISQESAVFSANIYDNITFWDDRTPENMAKLNRIIDMCALREFIDNLPDGLETLLGNNGINLSGGQKQRISIARELYKDVELLLMDEATSALDSETENEIKENLELLHGKITIISIAHRLSTVKSADCLYLLERGQIVSYGSFDELKAKSLFFNKLAELQGL